MTALQSTRTTVGRAAEPGGNVKAAPVQPNIPCVSSEQDLWFSESPGDIEAAKAQCTACPIQAPCLAGALARHEPCGVWGGQLVQDGMVVPRKRPRGRPRKEPVAA